MTILALIMVVVTAFVLIGITVVNKERRSNWEGSSDYYKESHKEPAQLSRKWALIPAALALVLMGTSLVYAQDPGESVVLKNWGGSLAGHSEEAGFHAKAPWQSTVKYDVRNNILSFIGDGEEDYTGGSCRGPQLTINDRGGASADIDVQVNYALDPGYVETLYADYGTQENFVHAICAVDIRATAREVAGGLDTITILTNRGDFSEALYRALEAKWDKYGINIEQVNVQDVRYSGDIAARYSEAQEAEIAKAKAQNKQEAAKVEAETKVIEAQGEADANRTLSESLTPEVIQQHYIDALEKIGAGGNLVVVPEGSTPLVGSK